MSAGRLTLWQQTQASSCISEQLMNPTLNWLVSLCLVALSHALICRYGSLTGRRGAFADSLQQYGNSLLLFPCFSFGFTRPVCQRAVYAIEDMDIPIQPIFINPRYLERLVKFWESLGLKEYRPSTGLYLTTLALEFCETVHLYGFWPFSNHPDKLFPLTNHYYNNVPYNRKVHAMPKEFSHLVELHNKGVLKLHLGDCKSDQV